MPTITDKEIAIRSGFMKKAISEIRRKHNLSTSHLDYVKEPIKEFSGSITCPICGGEIEYRVHSNGHIHGSCSSNLKKKWSCLDWKE